jgi:S-adenosylmethionine:tRNA ribosyltransferase-isomerase
VIASAAECREAPLAHEDEAALLVARRADGRLVHGCFCELGDFLRAGDLLVVNTSATLPAAVPATLDGRELTLHLSTPAGGERTGDAGPAGDGQARDAGPAGGGQARDAGPARGDRSTWVVELRTAERLPLRAPAPGAVLALPGGATAELLAPYLGSGRLSVARLVLGEPVEDYLRRHGRPIRYAHTADELPIEAYQTVFARDPGSAEMPSAARPFTAELVTELVARGVLLAPLTLHAGVSSLEAGESPYPERYRVPPETARLVNAVRAWGGRVIAVGTTVVRALETVAAPDGTVSAGAGQTSLVVTPERGLRAIDGLITGWHEPESSHLSLLEAAAGPELLRRSYAAAHAAGYRFHEFGDSHLILP